MFDQKWRQIYTVENAIVIYYENVELCALHISNYHNLIGERNSKQYLMPIHDIEQNRYSYFVSPKCFVWNARSFSWCHISVILRFCIKNTMPLISIFERVRAINCIRGLSSGGAAVNNAASWRKTPIQNATLQTDNIFFALVWLMSIHFRLRLNPALWKIIYVFWRNPTASSQKISSFCQYELKLVVAANGTKNKTDF